MKWTWTSTAFLCTLVSACGIGYSLNTLSTSHRSLEDSITRRDRTAQSIKSYQSIMNTQQDTLLSTKPRQDIEARIGEAIENAAITPRPRFRTSVQGDQVYQLSGQGLGLSRRTQGSTLREQRVSIQIPNLTVQQIGQVLVYWREKQQVWTPLRIELQHDQRSRTNQYTLQLECRAVYYTDGE